MLEPWLFFSLTAVLFYGVSQAVGKYAITNLSAPTLALFNFLVTMPVYFVFFCVLFTSLISGKYGIEALVLGMLGALFGRAGYFTYLEALESGPVTIVGSITAAYPALVAILAISLLGETLGIIQGLGVIVIIVGLIGLSYSHGDGGGKIRLSRRALFFSMLTLILWGVWGVFAKLALDVLPVVDYLGLYVIVLPPLFAAYMLHIRKGGRTVMPKWSVPAIIGIISVEIWQIGMLSDTMAVSIGNASIVFPLIASYPVVMILCAYGFLKERLSRRDLMLVAAVIGGIVLVSMS